MDITSLRRTAAEILAAAVFEMFPQVKLLGGSETYSGFYYDFVFPHLIHPELHLQIEEKMRQIVREKREVKVLEMVAVSAREFLKSKGLFSRAEQLEGKGLFQIIQIGNFIDLCGGDQVQNTAELSSFKLFPPISLDGKEMRILGTAHRSKEDLKEFIKQWNSYPRRRHEKMGEISNYWSSFEEGFVWLPAGVQVKEKLIRFFKKNLYRNALEIQCPQDSDRKTIYRKIFNDIEAEALLEVCLFRGEPNSIEDVGLLEPLEGTTIQITTSLKNVISFLQSIGKTLNILGFNYCVRFIPSRRKGREGKILTEALGNLQWSFETSAEEGEDFQVDFMVEDGLGRKWSAANILAKDCLSLRVVVERNLALLIELQGLVNFIV